MNCSKFEVGMQQMVEHREASLTEEWIRHVNSCAACRGLWEDHRLVDIAVRSLPAVLPPQGLVDRVLCQLLDDNPLLVQRAIARPDFRIDPRGNRTIVAVAALCLAVVIGLGWWASPPPQTLIIQQIPQNSTGPSTENAVIAVLADLQAEYRELAAETRASARELVDAIPPDVASVWKSNLDGMESNPGRANDSAATASPQTVTTLGRSLGDQIVQAMGFLRAAVPETIPRG